MHNYIEPSRKGTNWRALVAVREHSQATGSAFAVHQTIALYAPRRNWAGEIHVGQVTMAAESRLSESTVRRAIRELEALGELETVRQWTSEDGKTHNVYRSITLAGLQATGHSDRSVDAEQGQPVNLTVEYKGHLEIDVDQEVEENLNHEFDLSTHSPVNLTGRSDQVQLDGFTPVDLEHLRNGTGSYSTMHPALRERLLEVRTGMVAAATV